jgi:hypothetical protein
MRYQHLHELGDMSIHLLLGHELQHLIPWRLHLGSNQPRTRSAGPDEESCAVIVLLVRGEGDLEKSDTHRQICCLFVDLGFVLGQQIEPAVV